ncbi:MAG: hypothetical protein NC218_09875 [Acetobacter sp.]|nr:hypothetical protein [Acetobacter sp.]
MKKEVVASYAIKEENGIDIEIDVKNLSKDEFFRKEAIADILAEVKKKPQACVIVPSYRSNNNHLGQLINELALTLQVKTLVTGNIQNLKRLRSASVKEVVLIKQSFRAGSELAQQVATIKKMGSKVSIICLISHSRARLESFARENDVEISALVYTDEL